LEPECLEAEAKSQVGPERMGGGYASDRWAITEGGGYGYNPVSGVAGPREEETERRRIDKTEYMF
jgi:hypothetical protein